ncbi:MAG TPA: RNA polymerase sigma factor [Candidatus Angelobacter sp.]|nr:RNA polymerase sigma factor [Candidatus Angelobacter sp.]
MKGKGTGTTPGTTSNSMSDEELMSQVRQGVGEMLGVLFERYQSPLFNFYLKLTGDRAMSEDLVQEVFFRMLKYRQSYRPDTPFRAWMYQIARNARVDHLRRRRPETSWEPEMSPAIAPADTAEQSQETALLYRALMRLNEDKREVLVLSRFQDLKYEEIAQLLGCEIGTVKTRVHRALQELREIFHGLQGAKPLRGKSSEGTGAWPGSGSLQ